MNNAVYSFADLSFGAKVVRDLISEQDSILKFSDGFYNEEGIKEKLISRSKKAIKRKQLVEVLQNQNAKIELSHLSKKNIELLKSETSFTITTGHQLNVLTGPLFSIYKIAQAIVIATDLKKKHPHLDFVPVFWMATEDHDFEEINHLNLFNKKLDWIKSDQDSVIAGRLKTDSMNTFFDEVASLFQNEKIQVTLKELIDFYLKSDTLEQATRSIINHLFGEFGLVILDGDQPELKQELVPVFKEEIQNQLVFNSVSDTNSKLEESGYHQQVYVRPCNLFYIHPNGKRERIILENNKFNFNSKKYKADEVLQLIEAEPTSFSPNALLRPVYQELILPNLIYVGGGGEIAYWLQLKSLFDKLNVSFPLLRVRDSVFVVSEKQVQELNASGLTLADLQIPAEILLKNLTLKKYGENLTLTDTLSDLTIVKNRILNKVSKTDAGLTAMVEAEFARMNSALEKIEARLIKSAKQRDEIVGNRIVKLREKLFPNSHFQERHDNFLSYYLTDLDFIQKIISGVKPDNEPKIRLIKI